MSSTGIQSVSNRAAGDERYRRQMRAAAAKALEGYDLSVVENTTLRVMLENDWMMPGDPEPNMEYHQRWLKENEVAK